MREYTNLTVMWESEPELEAADGWSAVGEGRDTVNAGGCRSSWVPVAPESNSRGRFGNSHAEAVPSSLRSLASLALEDLRLLARLPRCTCSKADSLPLHPPPPLPSTPPGLEVCVCESTSWAILSRSFFILRVHRDHFATYYFLCTLIVCIYYMFSKTFFLPNSCNYFGEKNSAIS